MEGLDTSEVARIVGIREGTVRVRLHRARLFVRKELAKRPAKIKKSDVAPKPRSCREMFAALSDYMDGALDDSMCAELEKHLQGCVPCEKFLSSLEQTVAQCRSVDAGCKPKIASKMRRKLLAEYQRVIEALGARSG